MSDNAKVIAYFVVLGLLLVGAILIFVLIPHHDCVHDAYGNC